MTITNREDTRTTPATRPEEHSTPAAWSSRIEVHHLSGDAAGAKQNTRRGAGNKRNSSKIEKEIIWAVVVLYAGLIACFAGLHIFGLTLG